MSGQQHLHLVATQPQEEQHIELPDLIKEMTQIINDVDTYSLNRGVLGGLDWGVGSFNEAFEGLNPGLHLIAGQPNIGKSALCLQLAWSIAQNNRSITEEKPQKAYVLYFSLDDNAKDILPRVVSMDQRIPINIVTKPAMYRNSPGSMHHLARRDEGIRRLHEAIPYFKIYDTTYSPGCDNIDTIESIVRQHNAILKECDEAYQLVIFIDNFHDITAPGFNGNNEKYDYIAGQLSSICTTYNVPMICTAEFRKLNGARRPTIDDVRETVKISYEAKAIMLCYNEVGLRGEASQIFWEQEGFTEKRPVLEVKVGKNKFSSYKRRIYFEFAPEQSYLREATPQGAIRYSQMING